MNRHLVTVEICIERRTDQRMKLNRLTLDKNRLKRLDTQTVKCRRAVQKHWIFFYDLIKGVPNFRDFLFDHFFGTFNGRNQAFLLKSIVNKRFKELERHLLRQTALVKSQFRSHRDNGSSGVIHTLAQKILSKTSLLPFQGITQGFQGSLVGTCYNPAVPSIVKKYIHGFLEHPLFITHDNIRCFQIHKPFQTVVPVNDPPVKIVEIRRCKTSAFQWDKGSQIRRQDRNDIHDHPDRINPGSTKRIDYFKSLGKLLPFGNGVCGPHVFAELYI